MASAREIVTNAFTVPSSLQKKKSITLLGIVTISLLPLSIAQRKSQGQQGFKEQENRFHLLMGGPVRISCKMYRYRRRQRIETTLQINPVYSHNTMYLSFIQHLLKFNLTCLLYSLMSVCLSYTTRFISSTKENAQCFTHKSHSIIFC